MNNQMGQLMGNRSPAPLNISRGYPDSDGTIPGKGYPPGPLLGINHRSSQIPGVSIDIEPDRFPQFSPGVPGQLSQRLLGCRHQFLPEGATPFIPVYCYITLGQVAPRVTKVVKPHLSRRRFNLITPGILHQPPVFNTGAGRESPNFYHFQSPVNLNLVSRHKLNIDLAGYFSKTHPLNLIAQANITDINITPNRQTKDKSGGKLHLGPALQHLQSALRLCQARTQQNQK